MTSCGLIMWLHLLVQQQTSAQNKTVRQRGRLLYEGLQGQMPFDFCGLYEQGPNYDCS